MNQMTTLAVLTSGAQVFTIQLSTDYSICGGGFSKHIHYIFDIRKLESMDKQSYDLNAVSGGK